MSRSSSKQSSQPSPNSLVAECLNRFKIKDMNEWSGVNADLIITDPPFGIDFSGKPDNYNRDAGRVVDGYVEWSADTYERKIDQLLDCLTRNLGSAGSGLIFSGWNNSNVIHNQINQHSDLHLEGKLYWVYNFAPYCRKRPAHNVYEIYWVVNNPTTYFYSNECSTAHCTSGESNLSALVFKRDYKKGMPKYPTRLPFGLLRCLLEHYSEPDSLVFDPLAGSGMVGVVAEFLGRDYLLGDLNRNAKGVFQNLLEHYHDSASSDTYEQQMRE